MLRFLLPPAAAPSLNRSARISAPRRRPALHYEPARAREPVLPSTPHPCKRLGLSLDWSCAPSWAACKPPSDALTWPTPFRCTTYCVDKSESRSGNAGSGAMVHHSPVEALRFPQTEPQPCSHNLDREISFRDTGMTIRESDLGCNSLRLKILPLSDCSP
jgi:hypothetical protein